MPEVLADQQSEPGAAGLTVGAVERSERQALALAEEAALLEDAVRRQVDLAMGERDGAAMEQQGAVVEHALLILFDQAHDHRHLRRGARQARDRRRAVGVDRDPRREVEQAVAGERELGEEQELDAALPGVGDPALVTLEVALEIAQTAVDLGETDA